MEAAAGRVFGVSVERIEDGPLLKGQARFVDDIQPHGLLHIAFVRSPHAHAAIRSLDKQAALALAGVHAVWTLDDLATRIPDPLIRTTPPRVISPTASAAATRASRRYS